MRKTSGWRIIRAAMADRPEPGSLLLLVVLLLVMMMMTKMKVAMSSLDSGLSHVRYTTKYDTIQQENFKVR